MDYKKIITCLVIFVSLSSHSQSLKELLEGASKYISDPEVTEEKHDSTTVSGIKPSVVESDLVYRAVAPALKIVKQQYRLKKDGDLFGRNNMPHFGESFSLAVKVAGGTVLQNTVLYPWANDKDYKLINEDGKYTPVLYDSYQKTVGDSEYEKVDFELESPYVKQVGTDSLLYIHTDAYSDFGLSMDTLSGEKNGYMLWLYEDDGKYTHTVESYSVVTSPETTVCHMKPSDESNLLGGIYVVPVNERPGTISFYLVGVASKDNNSEWCLKLLTKEDTNINIIN